jgi:hypothetical protein
MKLFQSIFGRGETHGSYPESLIREAIERAVDGTDNRLRLVTGYQRHLREPVIHAIDYLLALALAQILDTKVKRDDLLHQRDLLQRKHRMLEHGGWSFDAPEGDAPDLKALEAELDEISAQLDAQGTDTNVMQPHMEIVARSLSDAESQLWAEKVTLFLDAMNIQRKESDPSARRIVLQELHNARGRRAVMLPVSLAPRGLTPREDFVTAAERYL